MVKRKTSIRPAKVRVHDYRPPGAGNKSPLERGTATRGGSVSGLDHLANANTRDIAEHDKAVRDYAADIAMSAATDLGKRRAWDRRDPEHRWVMNRLAALLRLLDRKGALA
jgi:hypothetical protein